MKDQINGYPVIASHATRPSPMTRAGRIVLVDRGQEFDRYVVAWQGDGDDHWAAGHYISDYREALADFQERCRAIREPA